MVDLFPEGSKSFSLRILNAVQRQRKEEIYSFTCMYRSSTNPITSTIVDTANLENFILTHNVTSQERKITVKFRYVGEPFVLLWTCILLDNQKHMFHPPEEIMVSFQENIQKDRQDFLYKKKFLYEGEMTTNRGL